MTRYWESNSLFESIFSNYSESRVEFYFRQWLNFLGQNDSIISLSCVAVRGVAGEQLMLTKRLHFLGLHSFLRAGFCLTRIGSPWCVPMRTLSVEPENVTRDWQELQRSNVFGVNEQSWQGMIIHRISTCTHGLDTRSGCG